MSEQNEERTVEFFKDLLAVVKHENEVEFEFRGTVGKDTKNSPSLCLLFFVPSLPIRIVIDSGEGKRNILTKVCSLERDKKFKKVYMYPELTHKQQEEDRVLRNILKNLRTMGSPVYSRTCTELTEYTEG